MSVFHQMRAACRRLRGARPSRHVAVAVLACCAAQAAGAHPHVWIRHSEALDMRGSAIVAIDETWVFSRGFPVAITGLSELPANGPLNAAQTQLFWEQAFSSLKDADYFTHLFVDGAPVHFGTASNFRVAIEDGHVVYRFSVAPAQAVDAKRADVQIGVWDDTFFVDYEPAGARHATLGSAASPSCKTQDFDDSKHPIFGGAVVPVSTRITC
jgi:ABC-type uncharacterized transport system substrate-binding protein